VNKAVFLDRDGIINIERGDFTWHLDDFVFNESIFPFCRELQSMGFLLIVITNQSGIARGLYTHDQLDFLHTHMQSVFHKEGIKITEIYYCPHLPSVSKCICRKPESVLVEKALSRFSIAAEHSWFVGDRERDIQSAERAGVRGILVESNSDLIPLLNQIFE
jgi:D-glycero-D-manno-heptose 1,7-bisphosphate phosphatase